MARFQRTVTAACAFLRAEDAAVAPLTALSLIGLIAMGGLAFDYSRMVALDTELQQAADHAALAAASQLDGKDDQCARAQAQATALVANSSRFTTDDTRAITLDDGGWACDPTIPRVDVAVASKGVDYSLMAALGLFGADLTARAAASLGTGICKVPPLMICNPQETGGSTTFDVGPLIGKGIPLKDKESGAMAPGNYGFLDFGGGADDLFRLIGRNEFAAKCISGTGVDMLPGKKENFYKYYNSRFDIITDDGAYRGNCGSDGLLCVGSPNSTKDLIRPSGGDCDLKNGGWELPANRYEPNASGVDPDGADAMGHPQDICHVWTGSKCGVIGDGVWDYDLYMQTVHGGVPGGAPAKGATRYSVYLWEKETPGVMKTKAVGSDTYYQPNICTAAGVQPAGVDRRVMTVAVINCLEHGVSGAAKEVPVKDWIDVFLVEPSIDRGKKDDPYETKKGDIYVEVIRRAAMGGNGNNFGQTLRRDVPYLVE